jgi:hypothetical protein
MTHSMRIGIGVFALVSMGLLVYLMSPFLGRSFSYSVLGQSPLINYQGRGVLNLSFVLTLITSVIYASSLFWKFKKHGPSIVGIAGWLSFMLNNLAVFLTFGLRFSIILWLCVITFAIGNNFLAKDLPSEDVEIKKILVYEYGIWSLVLISSAIFGSLFSLLIVGGS